MYSTATRSKANEAGWYQSRKGSLAIRGLHDAHLINALLRCLAVGDDPGIVEPLTREVVRRGLVDEAMREAERRSNQKKQLAIGSDQS